MVLGKYSAVSIEKKPRTGRYRVSTGPDSGYGETIKMFDSPKASVEFAKEEGAFDQWDERMVEYCAQDVRLTEQVYYRLLEETGQ